MHDNLLSSLLKSFDLLFKGSDGESPTLSHSLLGSVARITEQYLKVAGTDSDDRQVMFIMKEDPGTGRLQMVKHGDLQQISVKGPIRSFTQADIRQGQPVLFCLPRLPWTLPTVVQWELIAW